MTLFMESTSFHSTNILYIRIATCKIIQKIPFLQESPRFKLFRNLTMCGHCQWQRLGNPALKLDVVLAGVTNAWISAL